LTKSNLEPFEIYRTRLMKKLILLTALITTAFIAPAQTVIYSLPVADLEKALGKAQLVQTVFSDAVSGARKAYRPSDISKAYSAAEIAKNMSRVDTLYVEDPNPPYNIKQVVEKVNITPESIKTLTVMEEWVPVKSAQPKRTIKAIGPTDTRSHGPSPAAFFWVRWEDLGL
jgi:hypothetical protein